MTAKMERILKRLWKIVGEWHKAMHRDGYNDTRFIWTRHDDTGEYVVYADSLDTLKSHVKSLRLQRREEDENDSE